jgi:phage terminase Nu1 subunit (DNA packaging protein)
MTRQQLLMILNVPPAKLSQMLERGLPVRSDGDFNFDQVLAWMAVHEEAAGGSAQT